MYFQFLVEDMVRISFRFEGVESSAGLASITTAHIRRFLVQHVPITGKAENNDNCVNKLTRNTLVQSLLSKT